MPQLMEIVFDIARYKEVKQYKDQETFKANSVSYICKGPHYV